MLAKSQTVTPSFYYGQSNEIIRIHIDKAYSWFLLGNWISDYSTQFYSGKQAHEYMHPASVCQCTW